MASNLDNPVSCVKYALHENRITIEPNAEIIKKALDKKLAEKIFGLILLQFCVTIPVSILTCFFHEKIYGKLYYGIVSDFTFFLSLSLLKSKPPLRVKTPYNYILSSCFFLSLLYSNGTYIALYFEHYSYSLSLEFISFFITMFLLVFFTGLAIKMDADLTYLKTIKIGCINLQSLFFCNSIVSTFSAFVFLEQVKSNDNIILFLPFLVYFTTFPIAFLIIYFIVDVQAAVKTGLEYNHSAEEFFYVSMIMYAKGLGLKVLLFFPLFVLASAFNIKI